MPANNIGEPPGFRGLLWVVDPPLIGPESWLNSPEYDDFRVAYEYAATHFTVLGQLMRQHDLSPEDACLIWKCVETGGAVVRFRERQERLGR